MDNMGIKFQLEAATIREHGSFNNEKEALVFPLLSTGLTFSLAMGKRKAVSRLQSANC